MRNLRQECSLSPTLFTVCIYESLRILQFYNITHSLNKSPVTLLFADDNDIILEKLPDENDL